MRPSHKANRPRELPRRVLLAVVAAAAAAAGCVTLAEDVADHLVEKDIKALDQEFTVFHADLGRFRQCLMERSGSCEGSDTTALPHSSHARMSLAVVPVQPGSSTMLADSMAQLPPGDPAKSAMAILAHPVVMQAAALHNHLRGHDTGSVQGLSVEQGHAADGTAQSTLTISMRMAHVVGFHNQLLSSLGTTAWESLDGHCAALLAARGNTSGRDALEADCRRVAFIRGYLEAYLRKGEFLKVDVGLAGAIRAVHAAGAKIQGDIDGLLTELQAIETDVSGDETRIVQQIDTGTGRVSDEVEALVSKVESDLTRRFGKVPAGIVDNLNGLIGDVNAKSDALAQAADRDVAALASDLQGLLGKLATELATFEDRVASADQKLVDDINREIDQADAALSNVFKVSNTGFVSRDHTFQARLPTLELTFDPTAARLLQVTDVDTGQILTGASDFNRLGVVTDSSGVGTGNAIGADIVRIFLEAIFDAHEGLPAIAPANQPALRPTGLTLGENSLPVFQAPMGHIDTWDLSSMTNTNDRVAAMTRAIMSRIIAGIGPLSLNNQPLEDFIVEIITASVRQATAKATWCWYACNLDVELKMLAADARMAAEDKVKQIEDKAQADVDQVKMRLAREAEHVKLRIKLGN